jgi:hypothetical protein
MQINLAITEQLEIWMRSLLINKNLSFYYWLRRKIGKKVAFKVANTIEKVILIFGREQV